MSEYLEARVRTMEAQLDRIEAALHVLVMRPYQGDALRSYIDNCSLGATLKIRAGQAEDAGYMARKAAHYGFQLMREDGLL